MYVHDTYTKPQNYLKIVQNPKRCETIDKEISFILKINI